MTVECQQQVCDGWSSALALDGSCQAALAAQDNVCGSSPFFPGWDVCVALCDFEVTCSHPDFIDWKECWGQCKANSQFDVAAACGPEGYELRACIAQIDSCSEYADFRNHEPSAECFELSETWEQTCQF
jgi:hypothetical protein